MNTYTNEQRTNREQEQREYRRNLFISSLTLLFLILTTVGVFIQACILNSTDVTMNKQSRVSVRPWIGLTDDSKPIETTPIMFDKDGNASLSYKIITKNYSAAAAQGISAGAGLIISENMSSVFADRDELCKNRFAGDTSYGALAGKVQPGVISGAFASKRDISIGSDGKTQAWLFGCIGYRDQFNFLYKTSFIYNFADPVNTTRPQRFVPTANSQLNGEFVDRWFDKIE